jgi:hypothetical protein
VPHEIEECVHGTSLDVSEINVQNRACARE